MGSLKLVEMDEENRRLKEQMKWKMGQFQHLEEAYQKLKDEFFIGKEDWDVTNSALVNEVFELKNTVESRTRMSNELRSRLELCDHALVREESKIKNLETDLAESKAFYEKALNQCRDEKAELENLMVCRDEEIGSLRGSLVEKEAMCKEYKYMSRKTKLAEELKMKELVITELSSKLEDSEKAPMNSASNLESSDDQKDAEPIRDGMIAELKMELQECHSTIMQLKFELQESKTAIERLRHSLAASHLMRKQLEDCLLQEVENLRLRKSLIRRRLK